MKLRNRSQDTVILCGYHDHFPVCLQPGEVADLDLEKLNKLFNGSPEILNKLEPAEKPAMKLTTEPPAPPKPTEPSPEEAERAQLTALLQEK